jgi:signal transduction histidine kinase
VNAAYSPGSIRTHHARGTPSASGAANVRSMNRAPRATPPFLPGRPGPGGPLWRRWLEQPEGARPLPWLTSLAVLAIQQVGSQAAPFGQYGPGPGAAPGAHVPLDAFARLLLAVGPLLLLLRHRRPVTAAFGASAAATVYLGAGYPYGPVFLSVIVACFAALVAGHRYAAWGALLLLWAGHLIAGHLLYARLPPSGDGPPGWGGELAVAAWVVAVAAAAELARTRRQEWARHRAEAEAARRRRADEERLRIARELHDVLAHSISVINVQAGVGLALLDSDPAQARAALTTVKAASKGALGEVRQVLDTLRTPGDAPRAPAPGLDRLPQLTDEAAGMGLRVATRTEGTPAPLPPGADLAAFRIIQEALTNVMRHSASATARVLLRYGPGELEVRVDDEGPAGADGSGEDGSGADGEGPGGGGNGIVGMRERAAALGGTAEAGPRPDGGFRVHARLPLTDPAEGASPGTPPHTSPLSPVTSGSPVTSLSPVTSGSPVTPPAPLAQDVTDKETP